MDKVAIVTDSMADIPSSMLGNNNIFVLPGYIHFGTETYLDGADLAPTEFYSKLARSKQLPTTSQPTVNDFLDLYRQLTEDFDAIVSVHISTDLSGTFSSAMTARKQMDTPFPISIVDTRSVSMGQGFSVLAAARAAESGLPALRVDQAARAVAENMNVLFVVDTLEYLRKGGRIGGASAMAGSLLKIKPILQVSNGRIEALARARTHRKAIIQVLDQIEERTPSDDPLHVAVIHAVMEEPAHALADQIQQRFDCAECHVADIGSVVGVHVGPGTLGVSFYQTSHSME